MLSHSCPLPFPLAGSNHCQSSLTHAAAATILLSKNQAPFCCHLIPFPWIPEIFYLLLLFLLPEQLRSDPQCPHAVTGMKTSIGFQVLNRDHLFQNALAVVYTLYNCPWAMARTMKIKAMSCFQMFVCVLPPFPSLRSV